MEGKNLKSVGDEQTRESNAIEDTEEPDEGNLGVAGRGVGVLDATLRVLGGGRGGNTRVLVDGAGDGPHGERQDHTAGRCQEQRATTKLVDEESSGDGGGQIEDSLAGSELCNIRS